MQKSDAKFCAKLMTVGSFQIQIFVFIVFIYFQFFSTCHAGQKEKDQAEKTWQKVSWLFAMNTIRLLHI